MNWLMIVVMWMSVVVGAFVARVAEEELAEGKKYFHLLRVSLFFGALLVFGFMLFSNWSLDFGILFGIGIGFWVMHFFLKHFSFLKEVIFELFCFILATIAVLMWREEFVEIGLLFVSLFFMYGVVVGTLEKMRFDTYQKTNKA